MAKGRMLNRTISTDDRLNNLSANAQRLWFFTLPHIDRDGLIDGRPPVLWAMAAPLQFDLMDVTAQVINEWVSAGMVIRYNGDRTPILFFPAFQRNQAGMRYDREPPSVFAPPPGFYRDETGLRPLEWRMTDDAGSLPEVCRKSAGKCPPEIEVEVEDQDQEEDQEGEEAIPSPAPQPAPLPSVSMALDGEEETTTRQDPTTVKAITKHPAIAAYRETFLAFPSKALMVQILNHGIDDLPRWSQAVTAWCQRGYNPLNIGGMLEWYDNPDRMTGASRSANSNSARSPTKVSRSMDAVDQVIAMLERGETI